jgi:uncharacterized membrane-anchored protein YitT (DUF2179 family)
MWNRIISRKKLVLNYVYMLLGSALLAIGMVGFLVPNMIATGGTAGLSIVFHYLFDLPTGVLMVLINVPLLIVSVRYLGKMFAIRTIFTIICTSLFIDFLAEVVHFDPLSEETLLATLYGGVAVGLGLGLVFKGGASAGGGTILARIITSRTEMKTGFVILILDTIVVVLAGVVFNDVELALWSMMSIYVASKLVDLILTGKQHEKIIQISSQKAEEIAVKVNELLGIKGSIINGTDLQRESEKKIILIVVEKNKVTAVRNLVQTYDAEAIMLVMEATELLGPGYSNKS